MYIKREIEDVIRGYISSPEIIAIIGPRQCGKTTLLKEIFKTLKGAVYIDFEDRDILKTFNDDVKSFYNLYVKDAQYLFIDEFQYAKRGGKNLKYLYDTYGIKIFISGSSALDLTNQAIKYLVGRIFIFHLSVFSFQEFLSFKNPSLYKNIYLEIRKKIDGFLSGNRKIPPLISESIIKDILPCYYEYSIFGGYPRVVTAKNEDEKIIVLKNIYNTYLLREIRDILQLSTEDELKKLIKAIALQTGSMVAYNELGQLSSFDYKNLMSHLNILDKTYVIKRISPFYKNKRVEITKTPKIYFWDNGFRNMVINNFQPLDERVDRGMLNENVAATQLLKKDINIKYWRTKSNAEIDFVIENEGKGLTAIEVKSSLNYSKAGKSVFSFMGKYKVDKTLVLSESFSFFDKEKQVYFMPISFL